MAHAARARLLRDEFEAASGLRPPYPQSREALKGLRETLDRYNAAKANLGADERARLGQGMRENFDRYNAAKAQWRVFIKRIRLDASARGP